MSNDMPLKNGDDMKKNETFIATCSDYTYEGAGVVHLDDMVFFVPGLIVGEEAELGITALKKNYGYARIVRLLKPSKHRVEPKCTVNRLCGGCQLLHMDNKEQEQFKIDKVKGCFRMNAQKEVEISSILEAEKRDGYRNKVQVPVQLNGNVVDMGFYQNHTNKIINYDKCLMQSELSNAITKSLKEWFSNYKCAKEIRHVLIKHAHKTNEVMVCLIVRHYPFNKCDLLVDKLTKTYPEIQSIVAIENRREDNVILDGKEYLLFGRKYIEETLLGCKFRISARSFYQINPYATEILYQTALDYAGLTGKETLIDLYCGTGTIGLICAKHAKKVYGIEIVEDAIKDAKINAQINGISNEDFFVGDAGSGAQKLLKNHIKPDVVIVDPPRKGCSKETLNAVVQMNPDRIVYVSCDPATLARDCKYLEDNYELVKIQPVDMFPGTVHVETVVALSQIKNR